MLLGIGDLKVDQTALPLNHNFILITNFNIPAHLLHRLEEENIVRRIRAFIIQDYTGIPDVLYQVAATYTLRDVETGATRQWTGSFLPNGNYQSALSRFETFGPRFYNTVITLSNPAVASRRLTFVGIDTRWQFHRLTSIVINVQAIVPPAQPVLARRNLTGGGHGRGRQRAHASFLLP